MKALIRPLSVLRLVQGNGEVSQETIHHLSANTVKQFLLVTYVMVKEAC